MGLFITFILIGALLGLVTSLCFDDWGLMVIWLTVFSIIGCAIVGLTFIVSWDSAIDQHKRLGIIEQYVSRIEIYEAKAKGDFESMGLTDMKYNNYQTQLGEMVTELGKVVVSYNRTQIGKRLYNANWYFWGIICYDPELPKSITMESYVR